MLGGPLPGIIGAGEGVSACFLQAFSPFSRTIHNSSPMAETTKGGTDFSTLRFLETISE